MSHPYHRALAEEIPGVRVTGRGEVRASWDAAGIAAAALGVPEPVAPSGAASLPGIARAMQLALWKAARDYQKLAAAFLAERGVAVAAVPCRGGKCLILLMASEAIGAGRVLIVPPKSALYGWAEEVHKWTDGQVAVLRGRGARHLQWGCRTCGTTGRVRGDAAGAGTFAKCGACRGRGFASIHVRQTTKPVDFPAKPAYDRRRAPAKAAARTSPRLNLIGPRVFRPRLPSKQEAERAHELQVAAWEARGAQYTCPTHPEVRSSRPDAYCSVCRDVLRAALRKATHVLVTKERLMTHRQSVAGQMQKRSDLVGWRYELMGVEWDVLAIDETHQLAGRPARGGIIDPDSAKGIIRGLCSRASRVYGLSGTPLGDSVKSVWAELDILTGGLFGNMYEFDRRYLGGEVNEDGHWELHGSTPFVRSELRPRIAHWMHAVPDEEVHKNLPPITRIVRRIDPPKRLPPPKVQRKAGLKKALGDEAEYKMEELFDAVLPRLELGQKVIVYVNIVQSVARVYRALWKEIKSHRWREEIAASRVAMWRVAGGETKGGRDMITGERARYEAARAFREHRGPGVWISTTDTMGQGGVDLAGARSIVNLDVHWNPAIQHQAEERPNAVTRTHGIVIEYLVLRGGLSEETVMKLIPKLEENDQVLGTADNADRIAALQEDAEAFASDLLAAAQQMREDEDKDGFDLDELDTGAILELIEAD